MTSLTIVQPTDKALEPAYDAAADIHGSWWQAVAFKRLEVLLAGGFETYMAAQKLQPGLTVSKHLAMTVTTAHPGVLDAIRGGQ